VEKVIYALWRDPNRSREDFNEGLRGAAARRLLEAGVRGLRLNLTDAAVDPAAALRQTNTRPQIEAVAQVWLDVAHDEFRAPVDAILRVAASRVASWLVTESEPIRNTLHPPRPGERTEGWSQVCFLQRPSHLTPEAWREIWHGSHTRVAIDTQSNFEYVQNTIVRALTPAAPPYSAMVEECFPAAAMTDPQTFFNAVDDPARFKSNTEAMAASCQRFIDFDKIDVIPTSQYVIRAPG